MQSCIFQIHLIFSLSESGQLSIDPLGLKQIMNLLGNVINIRFIPIEPVLRVYIPVNTTVENLSYHKIKLCREKPIHNLFIMFSELI